MFALTLPEIALVVVWVLGLGAAVAAASLGGSRLKGVGLIAVALIIPVLGSLIAVVVLAARLRGRSSRTSERAPGPTPAAASTHR
jgi:hypothetical protein